MDDETLDLLDTGSTPLIAGTYRLIGEMGAGGGGIVYMGEHMRLGKKVVLKADKRPVTTKLETLRREVDALKNLSHTYIPQVYDYVVENDTVYTVMDYIDGDSFDKPLKRKERFTQAQVVEWACQLLEAVEYLHTRPPYGILHADIKPANIMLTPQGDIRLIDFNIALALGEEGAIAVGRSMGYASPEHYGDDFSNTVLPLQSQGQNQSQNPSQGQNRQDDTTEVINTGLRQAAETEVLFPPDSGLGPVSPGQSFGSGSSGSSSSKKILLDTRSDIYSLGATLYHILSGQRPAGSATDIKPLSPKDYSPAVISIIAKAMDPNPDLRWQSATDMLRAFRQIRENDPRTKRHKRRVVATILIFTFLFLAGGFTAFVGLSQMEQRQNALVLAERSGNALQAGDIAGAINYALEALPTERNIFTPPKTAEAQLALTNALGIYDLSDGFKSHRTIELPSAPFYMALSPDGATAAFVHASGISIHDTYTAEAIALLPGGTSALAQAVFLDNNTLIYAGQGVHAFDIANNRELWQGGPATAISLCATGATVAAIYRGNSFATVYDTATGQALQTVYFDGKQQRVVVNDVFANPNDNLLAVNPDWLGVSFNCGSLWLYDLSGESNHQELLDNTSGFTRFSGDFIGNYFAFSGTGQDGAVFDIFDVANLGLGNIWFASPATINTRTDENGIIIHNNNTLVRMQPTTGAQVGLVNTAENITNFAVSDTHAVISTAEEFLFFDANANLLSRHENNHHSAFAQLAGDTALIGSRDTPIVRVVRLESHPAANVFTFDPAPSSRLTEARICADRRTMMFFSFNRMRLYNIASGNLIAEVEIPDVANVFQPIYRRGLDGSYLEVIYNNGLRRLYCATDGTLIREFMGELPDHSFFEVFYTDTLRITSELHGVPRAYSVATGHFVRELERDAFLTYVTQAGQHIVTQYVTAQGYVFGILLNAMGEPLAYLPHLVDVKDEVLFFRYPTGNVRESRIYFIDELIERAREYN